MCKFYIPIQGLDSSNHQGVKNSIAVTEENQEMHFLKVNFFWTYLGKASSNSDQVASIESLSFKIGPSCEYFHLPKEGDMYMY